MEVLATYLFLCISPNWAGCGVAHFIDFGTPEACRAALSTMVVASNGAHSVGGDGKQVVAYCRPKHEKPK